MSEIKDKLAGLRINRPEESGGRGRVWIPVVAVLLVLVVAAAWWSTRSGAAEVRTAVAREVRVGERQTVLNASGYVTARRRATVSSKVTGKVVEVLIEEGMEVAEGQVLARLDDVNAVAAARLSEAQLQAARAELQETRVRLAEAKLDLARTTDLVANEVASRRDLDGAQAEVDSLAARLEGQRVAVEVAERAVDVAQQMLRDLVIRAPFAGIVVAKNAQPGEMISPMSAGGSFTRTGIGTIVDMDSLEIEVDVNEAYINRVAPEQRVTATIDAYPDWKIPCRVIAVIPTADRDTATVRVRIGFDQLDPRILPDMGIKVAFQGSEMESPGASTAVVVPRRAVRNDGNTDVVFVVQSGIVERRAIKVGDTAGEETYILSGLVGGERVVLDGPADLEDGDEIRVKETSS
jgi:HlyD family secretion protein